MSPKVSFACVVAMLASLGASRETRAAACCGTGYGVGLRLARAERAAATLSVRFHDIGGAWSRERKWIDAPTDTTDRELRLDATALVRVGSSLQLGVAFPWIRTERSFPASPPQSSPAQSSAGAGFGDVTALARWDFVPVGGRGALPGIAATLSASAPTGRPTHRSKDLLATDVTGTGAWEIRPGIAVEKAWWTGWFVVLNASIGIRAPFERQDGSRVALGPRASLAVAGGPSFTWGLGFALGLLHEREMAPAIDGVRVSGGARARTAALLVASYEVSEHWSLFATGQWDLPADELGRNEPGGWFAALGVRAVWNVWD